MCVMDIHLEGIEPQYFENGDALHILQEISHKGTPVVISPPPWMADGEWMRHNASDADKLVKLVGEIVNQPQNALGQQGNTHKCKKGHACTDPWHENKCPYGGSPSKEEQRDLMERGREKLTRLFGVQPQLYVPPNHLFNGDTLEAASEMGYGFFAVKSLIHLQPHKFRNLVIVPERDLTRGQLDGVATYIHYDEITRHWGNYVQAVKRATPLKSINVEYVNPIRADFNNHLVWGWKIARDLIKLPGRIKKKMNAAA